MIIRSIVWDVNINIYNYAFNPNALKA